MIFRRKNWEAEAKKASREHIEEVFQDLTGRLLDLGIEGEISLDPASQGSDVFSVNFLDKGVWGGSEEKPLPVSFTYDSRTKKFIYKGQEYDRLSEVGLAIHNEKSA